MSNSFSTAPANAPPHVPVGQLVDIPLEGGGESMYEVSVLFVFARGLLFFSPLGQE